MEKIFKLTNLKLIRGIKIFIQKQKKGAINALTYIINC